MTRNKSMRRRLCALLALLMLALLPLGALAEAEVADIAEEIADAAEDVAEAVEEVFPQPEDDAGTADGAPEAPDEEGADDEGIDDAAEEAGRPDLVGIWRAILQDGSVVLLELREDGTCKLGVDETSYEATWVQEESVAYLAQNGSIIPLYWDEQGITLSIGGKELKMERVDTTLLGTWVAHLEDSDALLVLKADGTCSMGVGTVKYTAKWSFSGETVTLEQNGSSIQGVYDGESITLPVGSFELRFFRQEEAPQAAPQEAQADSAGEN